MYVLQVNNTHRLTESNFRFDVTLSRWRPWRHFTHSFVHRTTYECSLR